MKAKNSHDLSENIVGYYEDFINGKKEVTFFI